MLSLKGNQKNLYENVKEYFEDIEFRKKIEQQGGYKKTIEKAHGQVERREYYQTEDVKWLEQKQDILILF